MAEVIDLTGIDKETERRFVAAMTEAESVSTRLAHANDEHIAAVIEMLDAMGKAHQKGLDILDEADATEHNLLVFHATMASAQAVLMGIRATLGKSSKEQETMNQHLRNAPSEKPN